MAFQQEEEALNEQQEDVEATETTERVGIAISSPVRTSNPVPARKKVWNEHAGPIAAPRANLEGHPRKSKASKKAADPVVEAVATITETMREDAIAFNEILKAEREDTQRRFEQRLATEDIRRREDKEDAD